MRIQRLYGFICLATMMSLACQVCSARNNAVLDSIRSFDRQINAAVLKGDQKKAFDIYFNNYFTNTSSWTTAEEDFVNVIRYIDRGIAFAKSRNNIDYTAIGYSYKAGILRRKGDLQKALEAINAAYQDIELVLSDSVKAIIYIELGDCYAKSSNTLKAVKYYDEAFAIALHSRNYKLETRINYIFANLYYGDGRAQSDTTEAKRFVYKNVVLARANKDAPALVDAYINLAFKTDNVLYVDTAFRLADSLKVPDKLLSAKRALFYTYGFARDPNTRNWQKAMNYLAVNPDLKQSFIERSGIAIFQYTIGQLFLENNRPDSALYYINLAKPALLKDSSIVNLRGVNLNLAICYEKLYDYPNAILYYTRTLEYNRQLGDLDKIAQNLNSLSSLYGQVADFEAAYKYKTQKDSTSILIDSLASEKELAYLNFEREIRKHDEELRREKERIHKQHNLGYLAIIIMLCVIFLGLTILGMFPVSKIAIKMSGFIAFICLFEFIILLIEHSVLHPITHGDPLTTWLLKIVLIAVLVKMQEWIEHRVIHYLQSRKLHAIRSRVMEKKWWKRKKAITKPQLAENESEDSGV